MTVAEKDDGLFQESEFDDSYLEHLEQPREHEERWPHRCGVCGLRHPDRDGAYLCCLELWDN